MIITRVVLILYGMILITGQTHAAEVAVIPSTQIVTPGSDFDMNISFDPQGTAIAGAQLDIAFDMSGIRVNSIIEGNLFTQGGANTFFNGGTINNTAGSVINIFDAIIGRKNVSTQGNFIIVNATAIGVSGITPINLSNVKISDPNGNPVTLNVTNGSVNINSPPVLTSIGDKMVNEGMLLMFTLSATDLDADTLVFSATGLPEGAAFIPSTKTFQWTPDYTQSGNYSIHFEVSDGIYKDEENIILIVNNINRAPTFTSIPSNGSVFNETDRINITVTANDPDGDSLNYIIKVDGVQVSASSTYGWITNYSNAGFHNIYISVSDGKAATNSTITIYVNNVYPRYDVDENGVVDIRDLVIIGQHFNDDVSAPYPRYDVNMDGIVDVLDLTTTAQHFGEDT